MHEKFMSIRKIVVPTLTMIIIASQLFGCAAATQDETLEMIQSHESIELEIAVPKDEEQGTTSPLTWTELASLYTYQETLRDPVEDVLAIDTETYLGIKAGMLYLSNEGFVQQNNTLKGALQNKEFRAAVDNEEIISAFAESAINTYADVEQEDKYTNFLMAINGYFNLLPDTEEGYANPDSTLTRAEFMALVMRAETPVDEYLELDEAFNSAVGESEYNLYAQEVDDTSYLTLEDSSLNNQTYNGTISRAEAIYMLMAKYYADDLANINTTSSTLSDAKDGGDIATEQGYTDSYKTSYELAYALNNPDEGLPTSLYSALFLAKEKGFIGEETRWDEGLTKSEAIELLVNIYKVLPIEEVATGEKLLEEGGLEIIKENGITLEEYNKKKEAGTLTKQDMLSLGLEDMTLEEYEELGADGLLYGSIRYNEDGTTTAVLDDGSTVNAGEFMPDGSMRAGITKEDHDIISRELAELMASW